MYQDMDLHICFLHMPCLLDNQCSIHIPVYNLDKDLLYIPEYMCKCHFQNKLHLIRTAKDCKDHHEEVLSLYFHKIATNKFK
jgi:hypothetical protein